MIKNNKHIFIVFLAVMLICAFSFSIYAFPEDAETKDVVNSSDHPLISRFSGSYIRFFEHKNYDKFILPFSNLKEPVQHPNNGEKVCLTPSFLRFHF